MTLPPGAAKEEDLHYHYPIANEGENGKPYVTLNRKPDSQGSHLPECLVQDTAKYDCKELISISPRAMLVFIVFVIVHVHHYH